MAQKSRKQIRKAPVAARPAAETAASAGATVTSPTMISATTGGRSFTSEFNPDYSQTIKDLKRIAILAGTFFAVLVILAFVLP